MRLRKTISVLLTMVLVLTVMPIMNTRADMLDAATIQSKLNTKMTQVGYIPGKNPPGKYESGNTCYGFCDMLCRYLFGHGLPKTDDSYPYQYVNYTSNFNQIGSTLTQSKGNLSESSLKALFALAQPGDVVQMDYTKTYDNNKDSRHTMMVYSVTSNGVVFYHAGSSNVYFGGSKGSGSLWGTEGYEVTWTSLYSYLKSSDDGISIYRSKNVVSDNTAATSTTITGSSTANDDDFGDYITPTVSNKPDIVTERALRTYYDAFITEYASNVTWKIDRDCTLWIMGSGSVNEWYDFSLNTEEHIPWYNYRETIKKVNVISTDPDSKIEFTRTWCLFYGFTACTEFNLSGLGTSFCTDMSRMFENCKKVTTLDLSGFDTSSCTDFSCMFLSCTKLSNLDISSFEMSSANKTCLMFYGCSSLEKIDLTKFDLSYVTMASQMFDGCNSLTALDCSSFNMYRCTHMQGMFAGCTKLKELNLSGWDTLTAIYMNNFVGECREDLMINFGDNIYSAKYFVENFSNLDEPTIVSNDFIVPSEIYLAKNGLIKTPVSTTNTPTATVEPTVTSTVVPTKTPEITQNAIPTTVPTTTPTSELDVGAFVDRCYEVALGREADEEGFEYWVSNLNNGQACGAQVGYGFIFSGEYGNKNTTNEQFVKDMYAMFFGREADSDGFNYWLDMLNNETADRQTVFAGFANSVEFYNLCEKYGVVSGNYIVGVTNDQQGGVNCFVARLYKVCLNRLPDQGGQAGWVQKLISGEVTGTTCAYGFVFSPEFTNLNLDNSDFVKYMYKAFFGREADEEGLNYWVEQLDNGSATREDIFAGFSGSAEFANLCAEYGINA